MFKFGFNPFPVMNPRKLNIMLVDDDEIYRFIISKAIESTGFMNKLFSFSSGGDAVEYLKNNAGDSASTPDIIFLDVNMPYITGWGFLEIFTGLVSQLPKPVTIYMISASPDEADKQHSGKFNAVKEYLVKPVSTEKFIEIFSSICVTEIFTHN